MNANVQWHNESGGVFMINQYFKSNTDFDKQIKQLGLKLLDYTAELEGGGKELNEEKEIR